MKRTTILLFLLLSVHVTSAQFRGMEPRNPSIQDAIVKPSGNLLFGFIDPDRFLMQHSVSMSYMNLGGQNMGLTMYTNSMRYQISEPLSVRADVSMVFSPFSSYGTAFQREISGIYLNRAQIDYQPSKNFKVSFQYRNLPGYGYYGYGGYGNPYSGSMFYDDGF